jgi:hypothetical protein
MVTGEVLCKRRFAEMRQDGSFPDRDAGSLLRPAPEVARKKRAPSRPKQQPPELHNSVWSNLDNVLVQMAHVAAMPKDQKDDDEQDAVDEPGPPAPVASTSTALVLPGLPASKPSLTGTFLPATPLNGPYVGVSKVLKGFGDHPGWLKSVRARSKSLSCDAHPLQFALLEACSKEGGPIARMVGGTRAHDVFRALLPPATELVEIVNELMRGWDSGLTQESRGGSVAYRVVDANAAFYDWFPCKLGYRVHAVASDRSEAAASSDATPAFMGEAVTSFVQEFVQDFLAPSATGQVHMEKDNPLLQVGSFRPEAWRLLGVLNDRSRRNFTKTGQMPNSKKVTDKRRALPMIGPLEHHVYNDHIALLERLSEAPTDADIEVIRGVCSTPWQTAVAQHRLQKRIAAVCRAVGDAFLMFIDARCPMFRDDVDPEIRNGVFALTAMQTNVQAHTNVINRVETWVLKLYHRFMSIDDTRLKDHKYDDCREPRSDACYKQHQVNTKTSEINAQHRGQLGALTISLIMKNLFVLVNIRLSAFNDVNRLPSNLQTHLPKTKRRAFWQDALKFYDNDADACKSAVQPRADCNRVTFEPQLLITDCTTLHAVQRARDAVVLATLVVGANAACDRFADDLRRVKLDAILPPEGAAMDADGPPREPRLRVDWFGSYSREVREVVEGGNRMPWLALETRLATGDMLEHLDALIRAIDAAVEFHACAVEQTERVDGAFTTHHRLAICRIEQLRRTPDDQISMRDRVLRSQDAANTQQEALIRAFDELRRKRARVSEEVVGAPPWRWQRVPEHVVVRDDGSDQTVQLQHLPERSRHVVALRAWRAALVQYATLVRTRGRPNDQWFNFLLGAPSAELEQLIALKPWAPDDTRPVDFANIIKTNASSEHRTQFRLRVARLQALSTELCATMARVMGSGFSKALQWADVCEHPDCRLPAQRMPTRGIGVSGLVQFLSIAAAYDLLLIVDNEAVFAKFQAGEATGMGDAVIAVLTTPHARDIALAPVCEMERLAKADAQRRRCVAALTVAGANVLTFNTNNRSFCSNRRLIDPEDALVVFNETNFVTIRTERVDALRAGGIDPLERIPAIDPEQHSTAVTMASRVDVFPSRYDFLAIDADLCTPEKFGMLFYFAPDMGHRDTGFFRLVGAHTPNELNNGILNVHEDITGTSKPNWSEFFLSDYASASNASPPTVPRGLS